MSAERFKWGGQIAFYIENISCVCRHVDFDSIEVFYYNGRSLICSINLVNFRGKLIQMLEYEDKYTDATFTRAFIISLMVSSEKNTRQLYEIFDLMVQLRERPRVVLHHIEIADDYVTSKFSYCKREKLQCNKKSIIRFINSLVAKVDKNTSEDEFKKLNIWSIYGDIKCDYYYITKYNIEKIVSAQLPQPIAEEICEYLL